MIGPGAGPGQWHTLTDIAVRVVPPAVLLALSLTLFTLTVVPHTLAIVATVLFAGLASRLGGPAGALLAGGILIPGLGFLVFHDHLLPPPAIIVGCGAMAVMLMARGSGTRRSGLYGLYPQTEGAVLRSLLDAVPLVLLDRKGNVRRASNACEPLFGRPKKDIQGSAFRDLVAGFDMREHAHRAIPGGVIASPGPYWQSRTDDKTPVPLEIWLEHTPEGPILRLTDLGPRHAADAQARELHSQLNKVWRLNSLGEMAATLAHELNQPLGAAASYLHAAQEDMKRAGPHGQSAWSTAELAKAQMLRAGQIIRRMRELLTMERRALNAERVRRVVEDVLPILMLTGQEKKVQISVDIDSPDTVRMDRIQFQQALVNLVRNAVEASPPSTRVLITGRVLPGRAYEIAVEDSGPGIPPDQVERVFQPMTTTKSGGMGLGLSVTRTIVESHGGHLRVGSSRWGGARFSFNLATADADADE